MRGEVGADLGVVFGPVALELLDRFVVERVEAAIRERELGRRWLTLAEAADYLGCSRAALRKRVERGQVPYSRTENGRMLVDRFALDRGLEERRVT